ncbi:MAG: hypothetical protein LUC22_02955 [Prevotella sp.]|nr:hypothetical protein [Prevotella sp.]
MKQVTITITAQQVADKLVEAYKWYTRHNREGIEYFFENERNYQEFAAYREALCDVLGNELVIEANDLARQQSSTYKG